MICLCKKCFENNAVGSFYLQDANPGEHLTGYVAAYNENELLIKHITPDGFYDGFILTRIDDLIRIDLAGEYENKIACLYKLREQSHPLLVNHSLELYKSVLDFAKNNNLVLTVELSDSTLSGFVLNYNEDTIHLHLITRSGRKDGESIICIDEISLFVVDSITEQSIKLLYFNSVT